MNRRNMLKTIAAGATVASVFPISLSAKTKDINTNKKTTVIVCGAGFGGLTTAKYLKKFNPDLEVKVIEKNSHFISCPYSNVWLGDVDNTTLADLSFDYLSASVKNGYEFINETIVSINKDAKTITTNNETYSYDYLVLSGGIEYDYSTIFKDKEIAKKVYTLYPPAMKPGSEHLFLKKKVENFKGGNFIINVPGGTYRCPPAPYERACMVAYYFKKHNINGKVVLIDPREKPGAKPKGFLDAFKKLYKDYIVYLPTTEIKDIDFESKVLSVDTFEMKTVSYVRKDIKFEDANIIPDMKPSNLVNMAQLKLNKKGWPLMNVPTFESVSDNSIYIVGDSNGYPYPKSGHMANSCGYIAAKQLAHKTFNKPFNYSLELPSNICYSMVNGDPLEGISVHHTVSYSLRKGIKVKSKSTPKKDEQTGKNIKLWYEAITSDIL